MRLIRALASPSNSPLILSLSKDERLAHDRPIEPRAISAAGPSTSSGQAQDERCTEGVKLATLEIVLDLSWRRARTGRMRQSRQRGMPRRRACRLAAPTGKYRS